jgi:hypothetical protein
VLDRGELGIGKPLVDEQSDLFDIAGIQVLAKRLANGMGTGLWRRGEYEAMRWLPCQAVQPSPSLD